MQKGFTPIILLPFILPLIFLGLMFVYGIYWYTGSILREPTSKSVYSSNSVVTPKTPQPTIIPVASPAVTPAETANWKTYTDQENKYQFKYPTDFVFQQAIKDQSNVISLVFNGLKQPSSPMGLLDGVRMSSEILVIPNKTMPQVAEEDRLNTQKNSGAKISSLNYLPKTSVNNIDAVTYSYLDTYILDKEVFIDLNGKTLKITYRYFADSEKDKMKYAKWLDQILSTFKLLNEDKLTTQNDKSRKIKLYYYNLVEDKKIADYIPCEAVLPVDRETPITPTPIQDAINLLLEGELTAQEKNQGFSTEFPHQGFRLIGANLKDGILTLEFPSIPSFTTGGSCRVGLLIDQIEKTAKQFLEVKEVKFKPEVFQP